MIKHLRFPVFVVLLSLLFSACNSSDNFKLTLSAPSGNFDGEMVYLYDYANQMSILDSALFDDGEMVYTCNLSEPFVLFAMTNGGSAIVVAEPGEVVYNLDNGELSGTSLNDTLMDFGVRYSYCQQQVATALGNQELSRDSTLAIMMPMADMYYDLYKNNVNNILGRFAFSFFISIRYGMFDTPASELEQYFDGVSKYILDYPPVQEFISDMEIKKHTDAGSQFVDVEGVQLDGSSVKLSDIINGHIAVVDFWASWCAPCCYEISETLVPLYNKYKDKGVVVVGVSLDKNVHECQSAVQKLGIAYPTMVDVDKVSTKSYAIDAIPHIMVVDAQGNIVKRGLRGPEVEEAVKQLLSK